MDQRTLPKKYLGCNRSMWSSRRSSSFLKKRKKKEKKSENFVSEINNEMDFDGSFFDDIDFR